MKSAEQQARDLLEECGVEDAQSFSAGDVVALANLIADVHDYRRQLAEIKHLCTDWPPVERVDVDAILDVINRKGKIRWTP